MSTDPTVLFVHEVQELKGALHIQLSCGHKLLRWGGDWSWQSGRPHLCEACIAGDSGIGDVHWRHGALWLTLICPGVRDPHLIQVPIDDELFRRVGITADNASVVLQDTTWRCPRCHPIATIQEVP
jgi:hypothetical protein